MKFFQSPVTLVKVLKEAFPLWRRVEKRSSAWAFGKEGEAAYQAADTPEKKLQFFLEYFTILAKEELERRHTSLSKPNRLALYQLAYLFANYVADAGLPYSGYPDILTEGKNPLLDYVSEVGIAPPSGNAPQVEGAALLACLHGSGSHIGSRDARWRPFEELTPIGADGAADPLCRLERAIIALFCRADEKGVTQPFVYDAALEIGGFALPDEAAEDEVEEVEE